MNSYRLTFILLAAATLGLGATCRDPSKDKALATDKTPNTSVSNAIAVATSNANAALVASERQVMALTQEKAALEQRASKAAAQVGSIAIVNTNQPAGPVTEIVQREAALAMTNLPPADLVEALAAEKRRSALLSGQVEEGRKLYTAAQTESERMKAEAAKLKTDTAAAVAEKEAAVKRHDAAQAALADADLKREAQLKLNEATNQAKLDAANKKADEAVRKAYEENQKTIVWILVGIGGLCILAGFGLAIATQGTSLVRSGIAVACGSVCFGLAKVISHPWFNTVFVLSLVLLAACGGAYMWYEWKCNRELKEGKVIREAAEQMVQVIDDHGVASTKGELTPAGRALSGKMDKAHKSAIRKLRLANEAKVSA